MTAHSEIAHSTPDGPPPAVNLDAYGAPGPAHFRDEDFRAAHEARLAAVTADSPPEQFADLSHADQIRALANGEGWRADHALHVSRQEQEDRLAAVTADGPRFTAYAGLDLSLTATGVAVYRPEWPTVNEIRLRKVTSDPADYRSARDAKDRPVATYADRLNRLEDVLASIEDTIPPAALVFLEAPSYGSSTSGTFDRSGLWWLVYQRLTALSCRVIPVAPTQRMLYATGKGRADKDQVIAAVVRRYPDLDVRDNNVADAVVLAAMAARAAGFPLEESLPAANLKAMDKLEAL